MIDGPDDRSREGVPEGSELVSRRIYLPLALPQLQWLIEWQGAPHILAQRLDAVLHILSVLPADLAVAQPVFPRHQIALPEFLPACEAALDAVEEWNDEAPGVVLADELRSGGHAGEVDSPNPAPCRLRLALRPLGIEPPTAVLELLGVVDAPRLEQGKLEVSLVTTRIVRAAGNELERAP